MKKQLYIDVVTITLSKSANPFLRDKRKRANVRWFKIKVSSCVWNGDQGIALITGEREVPIDNPFNQMGWKKILFKDFSEFLDVFVETQPCVVDLVGSINKSANETRIVGIKYKAKIISHQSTSPTLSY